MISRCLISFPWLKAILHPRETSNQIRPWTGLSSYNILSPDLYPFRLGILMGRRSGNCSCFENNTVSWHPQNHEWSQLLLPRTGQKGGLWRNLGLDTVASILCRRFVIPIIREQWMGVAVSICSCRIDIDYFILAGYEKTLWPKNGTTGNISSYFMRTISALCPAMSILFIRHIRHFMGRLFAFGFVWKSKTEL